MNVNRIQLDFFIEISGFMVEIVVLFTGVEKMWETEDFDLI